MVWFFIVAGLMLLTLGAEMLISGASRLARRLGLSELLIGLTLVGFGTSSPELVASVNAALAGSPGLAIGNVVGSNIANILLILGLSALIAPIAVGARGFRRDALTLAAATLLIIGISMVSEFDRYIGAGLLIALTAYLGWTYFSEQKLEQATTEAVAVKQSSVVIEIALAGIGLAFLALGAKLLVSGSIGVAVAFGVSETLIGLTIVALGTSAPELVTSVMASIRGKSDLALGNIIGSNIFNLLGILGVTALVQPLSTPDAIIQFDNWVMFAATAALILFGITKNKIERWEGGVLTMSYVAYITYLVMNA